MTLDKSKKYEFAGDVYSWQGAIWRSNNKCWTTRDFEYFANKGLVKEVREPIVGRGRVTFNDYALIRSSRCERFGLTVDEARNRTFDIVATEVME